MKQLNVPLLPYLQAHSPLSEIGRQLDELPPHEIGISPWPSQAEQPRVKFSIAYCKDCLFLRYYVIENSLLARYRDINAPVYKDSCVEFFISFGEAAYYNLEFNCLGTGRIGFGASKNERELLPPATVAKVRHSATIHGEKNGSSPTFWALTLAIPSEVFSAHTLTSFEGLIARANFYKCGDDLPSPHYLTWSKILAPEPNFHLPEFFGEIRFMPLSS